jgi:thiosulfate/3-mercaptopyruvate sulfurtransferase
MEHALLVKPEELYHILSLPGLLIIDARTAEEYEQGHITDAVHLPPERLEETVSLDNQHEVQSQVTETSRAREVFRSAGIRDDSRIVVYDAGGTYRAARLLWIFHYFGHSSAQLLDGGFEGWREDVNITNDKEVSVPRGNFTPKPDETLLADFFTVITSIGRGSKKLCNSLDEESFAEGAIPGSVNLPYEHTFRQGKYPMMRNKKELLSMFEKVGATPDKEVICYCGVGYSSCQLYVAAKVAGFERVAVYDGSMQEWKARGGELLPYGGVKK